MQTPSVYTLSVSWLEGFPYFRDCFIYIKCTSGTTCSVHITVEVRNSGVSRGWSSTVHVQSIHKQCTSKKGLTLHLFIQSWFVSALCCTVNPQLVWNRKAEQNPPKPGEHCSQEPTRFDPNWLLHRDVTRIWKGRGRNQHEAAIFFNWNHTS